MPAQGAHGIATATPNSSSHHSTTGTTSGQSYDSRGGRIPFQPGEAAAVGEDEEPQREENQKSRKQEVSRRRSCSEGSAQSRAEAREVQRRLASGPYNATDDHGHGQRHEDERSDNRHEVCRSIADAVCPIVLPEGREDDQDEDEEDDHENGNTKGNSEKETLNAHLDQLPQPSRTRPQEKACGSAWNCADAEKNTRGECARKLFCTEGTKPLWLVRFTTIALQAKTHKQGFEEHGAHTEETPGHLPVCLMPGTMWSVFEQRSGVVRMALADSRSIFRTIVCRPVGFARFPGLCMSVSSTRAGTDSVGDTTVTVPCVLSSAPCSNPPLRIVIRSTVHPRHHNRILRS
eukprot:605648-Rhodomonas_salina.2